MKSHICITRIIKALRITILFCLMLFATSCKGLSITPTPSATPLPSFTPTSEVEEVGELSDCSWTATGRAWNDDKQDGVWNAGEQPLANVKFWVDDTLNNYQKVNEFLSNSVFSNAKGNAEISVSLPGCPEVAFVVYTEAPQNCELTTEERIPINLNSQYPVYSFGFVCH